MLKPLTYEGRFEMDLDDIMAEWGLCAFVPVIPKTKDGNIYGLGVAVANEPGYHPIPLHWAHADSWEEMSAHANELNAELLNLDKDASARIVLSSMRGKVGAR